MRQKIIEFVFLFLCLFLLKGTVCSAAAQVETGSCGEHATWTLDDENVLTIRGTGKISDNSWEQSWEWRRITDYPSPHEHSYEFDEDDPHFVTVVIEDGITEIGENIFANSYIKKISIPNSVTRIGADAFETSSVKRMDIPDSVVEIGSGAFARCQRLSDVHLPKNLTKIPSFLFLTCGMLESVTIPDSVTEIGVKAFGGMENLKEITIGRSVTAIPEKMFEGCLRLRKIVNQSQVRFNFFKLGVVTKRVTWQIDGTKAVDIPPGQTVTGQGKKYQIRYVMKGTKVRGKLPKSFRYGEKVEFPDKVTKKGYLFVGWGIYHDRGGGWWEPLYRDSQGVICYDAFLNEMSESASYKIRPYFVKVKIRKKSKKKVIELDCSKLPWKKMSVKTGFSMEADGGIAIRYADNKRMQGFRVGFGEIASKKWTFVLPKSFQNRKCYLQFALVYEDYTEYYEEVGWDIFGRLRWFWSKSVVCKGK